MIEYYVIIALVLANLILDFIIIKLVKRRWRSESVAETHKNITDMARDIEQMFVDDIYKYTYCISNVGCVNECYELYRYHGIIDGNVKLSTITNHHFTLPIREFYNDFAHINHLQYDSCSDDTRLIINDEYEKFCKKQDVEY